MTKQECSWIYLESTQGFCQQRLEDKQAGLFEETWVAPNRCPTIIPGATPWLQRHSEIVPKLFRYASVLAPTTMPTQKPNIEEQQSKFLTKLPYLALGHPSFMPYTSPLHKTLAIYCNSANKRRRYILLLTCNPGLPTLHHSVAWDGPQHEKPYLRCRRCWWRGL